MRRGDGGGFEYGEQREREKAEMREAVARMVERLKRWDTRNGRDAGLLEEANDLLLAAQGLGIDAGELEEAIAAIKNSEGWKIETEGRFSPEGKKEKPSKDDGNQ